MKIGSVVFELNGGEYENRGATWPKLAYNAKYLNNYRTSLYQCFGVGRCIYADHKTDISSPRDVAMVTN